MDYIVKSFNCELPLTSEEFLILAKLNYEHLNAGIEKLGGTDVSCFVGGKDQSIHWSNACDSVAKKIIIFIRETISTYQHLNSDRSIFVVTQFLDTTWKPKANYQMEFKCPDDYQSLQECNLDILYRGLDSMGVKSAELTCYEGLDTIFFNAPNSYIAGRVQGLIEQVLTFKACCT